MAGRYKILEELGAGGAGAVFKAYDTQLDRYVAIKRLMSKMEADKQDPQSGGLKKEAASLATLQHPNIVSVYDLGSDEAGYFMVMELVDGETLADWVKGGPMGLEDFQELATQSLEAVLTAHSQSILHRDLKPENIKLKRLPSGRLQVKILDFGLARLSYGAKKMTEDQRGTVMGSIHYMAPEQFLRRPIDGRTDLYSLGCVFYQTLSGRRPYDDKTVQGVMEAHLQHRVHSLKTIAPHLPQPLCDWIMWLINADPIHRPANAQQAIASLKDIIAAGWFGRASEAVPIARAIPAAEPAMRPATGAVRPPTGAIPRGPATPHGRTASGVISQRLTSNVAPRPTGTVPRRESASTQPPTAVAPEAVQPQRGIKGIPIWVWPAAAVLVLGAAWFFWPRSSKAPAIAAGAPAPPQPQRPADFLQKGYVIHYRAGEKMEAWSDPGKPVVAPKPGDLVLTWHDLSSTAGDGWLAAYGRRMENCPRYIVEKNSALKGEVRMLRFTSGQGMTHRMSSGDTRINEYPFGDPAKSKGVTAMMLVRPQIADREVRCLQLRNQDGKSMFSIHAYPNNVWKFTVKCGTSAKEVKVTQRSVKQFTLVGLTWNTETNKMLLSVRGEDGGKGRAETDAPRDPRSVLNEVRIGFFSPDTSKPVAPEDKFAGDIVELVVWPHAMDWNERSTQEMKFMRHFFHNPGTQF